MPVYRNCVTKCNSTYFLMYATQFCAVFKSRYSVMYGFKLAYRFAALVDKLLALLSAGCSAFQLQI